MGPTEAQTRQDLIDQQLRRWGWSTSSLDVLEEHLVRPHKAGEEDVEHRTGFADYVLLDPKGQPLAVVEAKRSSRDPVAGKRQAVQYADRIAAKTGTTPFIYLANGRELWFWDRPDYPLREVQAFRSQQDLVRLRYLRDHRKELTGFVADPKIAGGPRWDYQREAVRHSTERLAAGHRKLLLVMATGTGKTRTAIALVDLLFRAGWIQRVLFLADRRELAKQAADAFRSHLSQDTPFRIEGGEVDPAARVHVATYPSMMQVYERLSPGYYDLVIADESHRSIYNRYKVLLDHFDSLQLGLTATPTEYIDHNTFSLFGVPDGAPTFTYGYEEARDAKHLASYQVLEANTSFQIEGIRSEDLPPELRQQVEDQGVDLGDVDFAGTDLERRVTNTGTTDAIVREFMDNARRDGAGALPAKAIIFCMSHAHAKEVWKSFNRLYPDLQRRDFAQIIDSHMERVDELLDDFKTRDFPRVAISVDMLDTGLDVPSLQTLVFAKPVYSKVKFWQMIGRGTRRWIDPATGKVKESFLIIDHWDNFARFRMKPEGEPQAVTTPLPTRLIRTRLELLLVLRAGGETDEAVRIEDNLRAMIADIPGDNANVRPHLEALDRFRGDEVWRQLDHEAVSTLRDVLAPLGRFIPDVRLDEMGFELLTEQAALAAIHRDTEALERLRDRVRDRLGELPPDLAEVRAYEEQIRQAQDASFWATPDVSRLRDLGATVAPLMRYCRRTSTDIVRLSLPDQIVARRWVLYGPSGEGAYAETYRQRAEAHVRSLAATDPVLRRIRSGEKVGEDDLEALADRLHRPDLFLSEGTLQDVYDAPEGRLIDFLQHMLSGRTLPTREAQIHEAFDAFLAAHPGLTALQLAFLRLVRSAVAQRTRLTAEALERPPFARVAPVHQLFSPSEIDEVLTLADRFAA